MIYAHKDLMFGKALFLNISKVKTRLAGPVMLLMNILVACSRHTVL